VDGAAVVLEVRDQGPGIDRTERDRVFERFHRAGAAQSASGGTGLGLAIARWAVTLHGGTIGVVDSADGCIMRVHLPCHPRSGTDHQQPSR
jgi:signal transduction histidine kinase